MRDVIAKEERTCAVKRE